MIMLPERKKLLGYFAEAIASGARRDKAARTMGLNLRTLQRWQQPEVLRDDARTQRQFTPANKLTDEERKQILVTVNSEEFKDKTPHQIVPILAERGDYIGSEATMYRILREEKQLVHRHADRANQASNKPKALAATAPNQIYSWDITYLSTTVKGVFFYLYLFVDIFSRKIVGWQVFPEESSQNAADLIRDICEREQIEQRQLTLHSDNGSPMKGATMLATLQKLGVITSLSRPSVSNDNAYSESLFKTLKYNSIQALPAFEDITAARIWVEGFVHWYNEEHRHSGIQFVTPSQRHNGEDKAILIQRQAAYEAAKAKNPERWANKTRNWEWQATVYLNPENSTAAMPKNASNRSH